MTVTIKNKVNLKGKLTLGASTLPEDDFSLTSIFAETDPDFNQIDEYSDPVSGQILDFTPGPGYTVGSVVFNGTSAAPFKVTKVESSVDSGPWIDRTNNTDMDDYMGSWDGTEWYSESQFLSSELALHVGSWLGVQGTDFTTSVLFRFNFEPQ